MITVNDIRDHKEPITMTTAYDATMARLIDGIVDIILVGDSLGMVVQGHPNTIPVDLDHAIYHTECVARVTTKSHIVGDLPFMSYQVSPEQAVESAGKLIKAGAHSVKLEGGGQWAMDRIYSITKAGIPVMGHLGLTPQSIHKFGGFKRQGKTDEEAALIAHDAGWMSHEVFAIVLECIPSKLAKGITGACEVPTIGIGSGPHCDGQVLVSTDILGMSPHFCPKFAKQHCNLAELIQQAMKDFVSETKNKGKENV